ncbi:MAG: 5-(carboxyamino)imidazole ribonucleotide synthase [Pseudomonadota bacterium]
MRIGIIGAGQLGQMLGFAARELGHECEFLDPSTNAPAAVCGVVRAAAFDDQQALRALAGDVDVLTYEFENVPVAVLEALDGTVPIYPPLDALKYSQDRLAEKQLFERLGIPLPAYHPIDSADDLHAAAAHVGVPLIVKTRRLGYDGKGQYRIREQAELATAWDQFNAPNSGADLIAEQWLSFDREVSAIAARNTDGTIVHYPLTENVHRDGILHTSRAPVHDGALTTLANDYIRRLLEHLDYVGTLALELFVVGDQLLANEFAPRVHNSGHWTIEGADCSQFAAHVRAICGQPLEAIQLNGHAAMLNLIGTIPEAARSLDEGTLHDYGKEPRPGRKLGHITVLAAIAAECDDKLKTLMQSVN